MLRRIKDAFKRDKERNPGGLDLSGQQWVVVLLIGLASVLAAFFGWRAAAIGSTAAYDDRQSISETIKVEQRQIDIAIQVVDDTKEYTRYLAGYGAAAELDNQADALQEAGQGDAAAEARAEADEVRRSATARAADAGVFGPFSITDELLEPSPTPRPFNLDDQATAIAAQEATSFDSAGQLDPQVWADEAEDIRDRIQGLAFWTFMLLLSVLAFTIGQVNSDKRPVFYGFVALGVAALLFGSIGGFTTDFFA